MQIVQKIFDSAFLIKPEIFSDQRGFFYEFFNLRRFREMTGLTEINFVQDNLAHSKKGVLRGMHFQKKPYEQAKLVSVVQGEIWDVIVDLRKNSPTYLQYFGVYLNDKNRYQLYIPKGFAHGYLCLSDHAYVFYKTDAYYHAEADSGFKFDDAQVNIPWPEIQGNYILSKKDETLPYLKDLSL